MDVLVIDVLVGLVKALGSDIAPCLVRLDRPIRAAPFETRLQVKVVKVSWSLAATMIKDRQLMEAVQKYCWTHLRMDSICSAASRASRSLALVMTTEVGAP